MRQSIDPGVEKRRNRTIAVVESINEQVQAEDSTAALARRLLSRLLVGVKHQRISQTEKY